jgi:hypothetical protein
VDIDPGLLIFIFLFFVLPLIQQFLEAGKKKGRGPRERGQPPMGGRVPPPTRRPLPEDRRPASTKEQPPERAADLIPAELWEILTGERRAPTSTPAPAKPQLPPRAPSPEADLDEELAQDEEAASVRATTNEDAAAAELLRRREKATVLARTTTREPTSTVTLETEPLPEPLRHAAFHEQLKQTKTPVSAPPVFRHAMMVSLANRSDLKRAIILQEVLGPPKGLE